MYRASSTEHVANMRIGVRDRFTLPRLAILDGVSKVIASEQYADRLDRCRCGGRSRNVFARGAFESEAQQQSGGRRQGRQLVDAVMPANSCTAFQRFFECSIAPPRGATPSARRRFRMARPGYADLVRYFATGSRRDAGKGSTRSGVAEVARAFARGDGGAILRDGVESWREVCADFVAFVRADPQFYAKTAGRVAARSRVDREGGNRWQSCRSIFRHAAAHMPLCGRKPVPEALAPNYTSPPGATTRARSAHAGEVLGGNTYTRSTLDRSMSRPR